MEKSAHTLPSMSPVPPPPPPPRPDTISPHPHPQHTSISQWYILASSSISFEAAKGIFSRWPHLFLRRNSQPRSLHPYPHTPYRSAANTGYTPMRITCIILRLYSADHNFWPMYQCFSISRIQSCFKLRTQEARPKRVQFLLFICILAHNISISIFCFVLVPSVRSISVCLSECFDCCNSVE